MFDVRRREEAEGERRIIGSGRLRFFREETRGPVLNAEDAGVEADAVEE